MKKISTEELAKKTYEKIQGLGIKEDGLVQILTFKHLRSLGVDCDYFMLTKRITPSPFGLGSTCQTGFFTVITFGNSDKVMTEQGNLVENNFEDYDYANWGGLSLKPFKVAQLYFAKVNTGMFKV